MELIQIIVTGMGVLMSVGYYPQAYKIWKTKSVKDISLYTYSIFSVGTLVWTIYGFYLGDLPIVFSFIIGVVGSWLVLGLTLYYRRNKM
jgi:MtN3 and saliva related transmembrane protein